MQYFSLNKNAPRVDFQEAVIQGLAPDRGLYFPESITPLPHSFFKNIENSEIKPKPGSLLIFPGNEEFEHGVRHIGKGNIRYVLIGFIRVKGFYESNKY